MERSDNKLKTSDIGSETDQSLPRASSDRYITRSSFARFQNRRTWKGSRIIGHRNRLGNRVVKFGAKELSVPQIILTCVALDRIRSVVATMCDGR